ncbi:MAG: hypothetical protein WKF75_09910 [Singulisphaera sp.]
MSLIPGVLKLRVGVVSTVGNYREHNEDNFYVPGRKSVRYDAPRGQRRDGDVDPRSDQPVPRRRRHGGSRRASRRA